MKDISKFESDGNGGASESIKGILSIVKNQSLDAAIRNIVQRNHAGQVPDQALNEIVKALKNSMDAETYGRVVSKILMSTVEMDDTGRVTNQSLHSMIDTLRESLGAINFSQLQKSMEQSNQKGAGWGSAGRY